MVSDGQCNQMPGKSYNCRPQIISKYILSNFCDIICQAYKNSRSKESEKKTLEIIPDIRRSDTESYKDHILNNN